MRHVFEYIKKHPMIVVAIIGGVLLLWLLLRSLRKGTVATVASPQIAPYAPASSPLAAASGTPSTISTSNTTTTDTSSVYAPTTNSSSVYSPTSSLSTVNNQSTVGPVSTVNSSYANSVSNTNTSSNTNTNTNTNTYNNPTYGLPALPTGFSGVAGIGTQPLLSPVVPVAVPASTIVPAQHIKAAVKQATQVPLSTPAGSFNSTGGLRAALQV